MPLKQWQQNQLDILMHPELYNEGDWEWQSIVLSAHKADKRGEYYIEALYRGFIANHYKPTKTLGYRITGISEIWDEFDESIRKHQYRLYEPQEQYSFGKAFNDGKSVIYEKTILLDKQLSTLVNAELSDGSVWHSIGLTAQKIEYTDEEWQLLTQTEKRNILSGQSERYFIQAVYYGLNGETQTERTGCCILSRISHMWNAFQCWIQKRKYEPQEQYSSFADALKAGTSLTYTNTISNDDDSAPQLQRSKSEGDVVYWHREAQEHGHQEAVTPITNFLQSIWMRIIGISLSIIGVFVVFQTLFCAIKGQREEKSSDEAKEKMSRVHRVLRLRAMRKMQAVQRMHRRRSTLRLQRMSISVTMLKTQRLGTSRLIPRMPRMQRSRERMQRVWRLRQCRERKA